MLLELADVSKSYPTGEGILHVLRGVSLALDAGESLALTGESGSGKSTLLHLAGGLDRPDQGAIRFGGQDIARLGDRELASFRRVSVGLVFQQFNLIPSLDVGHNLAFQARLGGRHDADWTDRLAERLGLVKLLERYPEQLSGGQQQRVAIGRALAGRPQLILADEPTGNLDEATGDAVLDLMLALLAETGAALLMVTHSTRLAARLGRRLHLTAGRLT
ncbi:ABC transporter ATP-binding protein [Aestuariivirga litoralis]|uniref:ABC transporter ATP-binding protein n=1 Tax=Aestuariivirga litoralis TaxID=2650924 RepID=A0A2W2ASC0_9HYPH|nr:ABC transporter ATP-binding protein [Aestuariivirga litoralis]PZF78225.1 ABC transporter ATP-binding protein [Aestuariivirga litoralis]